jgi:hypothetical protein
MAFSVSGAQDVLKEDYKPVIREQLNNQYVILELATQNEDDVEGIEAVLSTHQSRNRGVGARGELGTLPTAGQQGYKKSRVPLKFNYGSIKVSGPSIKATSSDKGSFTRAIASEVKGVVGDLKRDVNRQTFTNESGAIAITGGGTPTGTSFITTTTAQARRIEPGARLDIVEASTDVVCFTVDVVSVVISTKTVTTTLVSTGAGTAASTNRVVNTGVVPSENNEITGIEQIVDSAGTLFSIDPTVYSRWSSYELAVSGLPTDSVFEAAADEVNLASGGDVDLIVTSFEVARTYAATLKSQKRFSPDTLTLRGGFKAISVDTPRGQIALRTERDCETQEAYGLTTSALIHYKASDWEFMDEDGDMLSRVQGQDAYEATLFRYHELATDQRNSHFKLTSLTVA